MRIASGAFVALFTLFACSETRESPRETLQRAGAALRAGRLAEAATLARDGAQHAGDNADLALRWELRLLEAESYLLQLQREPAAAILEEPLPEASAFDSLRPRRAYLAAYLQVLTGQSDAAMAALSTVAAEAQAAGLPEVALDATILRAQRLLRQGKFDVADRTLLDALNETTDAVAYQRGAVLLNLGMSRFVRSRFDEALGYFEQVLTDRSIESSMVHRIALANAGVCYSRLGDFDRAVAAQQRAAEGHERAGLKQYHQLALGELGVTLLLQGQRSQGLAHLQRALDIATAEGYSNDAAYWAGDLAQAYGDVQDWDRAEHFNNRAIELKKAAGSTRVMYNLYNRARILNGRGRSSESIAAFEEAIQSAGDDPYPAWLSHAGLALVHYQSKRIELAITHYEKALSLIERTRADLLTREYRLTFLSRLISFHQDYVDALMEHGDIERALEVAESSRARVLAERQGVARPGRVPATAFVKLAARTRSTLLSYWLAPARSFVWIVTGDGIKAVTLPPRDEIAALVRGYRDFVTISLADPLASTTSPGNKLADVLLKPVLDAVPTSPTRLTSPTSPSIVIVPDDALHGLSFDMLPLSSPQPHYWIEDVTVTVTPSLALAAESQPTRAHAERSLLLVGDPAHVDQTLPPLTFAGHELSGITKAFGGKTDTLRGAEATPRSVTARQPERYSLIHFAAHATASAESPLDSAILLSPEPSAVGAAREPPLQLSTSLQASKPPSLQPLEQAPGPKPHDAGLSYKLYARDVVALRLTADVVTLSACRSAGGRAYGGEGLVGFAWAFLRAGARQVVAGLWDVDDQSTALLMERFYARLGAGAAPAVALRDAKLSLLKSGGNFRKPYYWAAFAVFSASLDPS